MVGFPKASDPGKQTLCTLACLLGQNGGWRGGASGLDPGPQTQTNHSSISVGQDQQRLLVCGVLRRPMVGRPFSIASWYMLCSNVHPYQVAPLPCSVLMGIAPSAYMPPLQAAGRT